MRGAPQVGFSATIRKIRSRTSFEILFLPVTGRALEIARQYRANPDLCHRTTVSGLTTMRACFHPDQNLRANTQKILSSIVSLGLRRLRFSVTSCWRRTRFSRSKLRRPRKRQRIVPSSSPKVSIIRDCYRSLLVERNAVSVEITGGRNFGERQPSRSGSPQLALVFPVLEPRPQLRTAEQLALFVSSVFL